MTVRRRRITGLLLTGAASLAAVALAGCDGDGTDRSKLLSSSTASELRSTLATVEQSAESGDCVAAEAQARSLQQQIGTLPSKVDRKLRDALADSAARLQTLVVDRCEPQTGPTAPAEAVPEQPAEQPEKDKQEDGKDKQKPDEKVPPGQDKKDEQPDDSGGIEIAPDSGQGGGSGVTP